MATNDDPELEHARCIHVEETGSTNEDALALARGGERNPVWLRADIQVAGRGRLGRGWASPAGNLYCSLLLHAPAEPRCLPQLAHVAAVALVAAVRRVIGSEPQLRLKWPNDLLFGPAKSAGILVEGERLASGEAACVIGWGVNCTYHPDDLPYPATDLSREAGRRVEADAVFAALRVSMGVAMSIWDRGRGYGAIRERWMGDALPIGTPISVKVPQPLQGLFDGIDAEGRLLLKQANGTATIGAGDIVLMSQSAGTAG